MWRNAASTDSSLNDIGRLGCSNATRKAVAEREALADWMIGEGQIPWQSQINLYAHHVNFPLLMQW